MLLDIHTEILVAGGGTSGVCAALQSARMGRKVIIVEETQWLGGMLTSAGVSAIDGNHLLPSGMWGEFRDLLYDHYGGAKAVATGWVSHTMFEPSVGAKIFRELVASERNITVYYGYRVDHVLMEGDRVLGAEFVNTQGDRLRIEAYVTIEATEYGDVLALAGCDYMTGRESKSQFGEEAAPEKPDDIIQDLTYVAILKDYGAGMHTTIDPPDGYNSEVYRECCRKMNDEQNASLLDSQRMLEYGKLPNRKYMINWPDYGNDYYLNLLELSYSERIEKLEAARKHTLGMVYYIQTSLGYSNLGLANNEFPTADRLPFIPYHRESRRVRGVVLLTLNHVIDLYSEAAQSVYKAGIAVGDYPLDHHHSKAPQRIEEVFPLISAFNVPYGCMIPHKVDGLIVAEKSISVTHIVNGCTRLQPVVMQIGQAAGAGAALAVDAEIQLREVNVRQLQQELLSHHCWLMPFSDIMADDWYFAAAQRVSVAGILRGQTVHKDWRNEFYFHPESMVSADEALSAIQIVLQEEKRRPLIRTSSDADAMSRLDALHLVWEALGKPEADAYPNARRDSVYEGDYLKTVRYFYDFGWKLPKGFCNDLQPEKKITRAEFAFLVDTVFDPFTTIAL
ncbi:FAD-dependent oxidoreductase [candidate division KSB1 bacterium]|nr:FAD-dependent oxidoreductase [candidate division KSB1 bacterium]